MFDSRVVGDVYVLTPKKNLVSGTETSALIDAVAELAAEATPKIVLDLHRIDWVSSIGIEALRRSHLICAEHNGWLRLTYVGARIKSILLVMRLHWVFETFDTLEEAVAPSKRALGVPPDASRARVSTLPPRTFS